MQKLKVKHLFFALGHGERTDFMQGFCGEYDPKVWRLSAKPARSSLATCPFFPVDLLKNECGAWLKSGWQSGFFLLLCLFPLRRHERKTRPAKYPVKNKRRVKKKSGRVAARPELPAMKQKEKGYGLISPVVTYTRIKYVRLMQGVSLLSFFFRCGS